MDGWVIGWLGNWVVEWLDSWVIVIDNAEGGVVDDGGWLVSDKV